MWYRHAMWHDIWHLTEPIGEKVVRCVAIYLFVVVLFRLFGKRELGQSNTLDLVVLLLVANAVQNGVIGNDVSVTGAMLGAGILLALNALMASGSYAWPWFSRLTEGSPTTLIHGGKLQRSALRRELISLPELRSIARRQGFEDLADVSEAILEPNGNVSMFHEDQLPPRYHPDESGPRIGKRRHSHR